jgi:hypothetical protein
MLGRSTSGYKGWGLRVTDRRGFVPIGRAIWQAHLDAQVPQGPARLAQQLQHYALCFVIGLKKPIFDNGGRSQGMKPSEWRGIIEGGKLATSAKPSYENPSQAKRAR